MPPQSTLCANCSAPLYEGESVKYDNYREVYYCDSVCAEEGYAESMADYMARNLEAADL